MYQDDIYSLSPNQWEWFAQDVLFHLGFIIHIGPSEEVDDGLDMVVEKNNIKYLVSCKHNHKTKKNVGVRAESDIRDRVEQHDCSGFIAFYSVGATTGLKKKLIALKGSSFDVVEIYLDDILDIIPTMRGFTLHKYFSRPQAMYHHLLQEAEYKPLRCMNDECGKDILTSEQIPWSMAGFHVSEDKEYVVFAVMVKEGEESETFKFLEEYLPVQPEEQKTIGKPHSFALYMLDNFSHYYYNGSLTTPPCTEAVNWFIFKDAISASPEQVKALADLMPRNNFRPTQPLNGRTVYLSE